MIERLAVDQHVAFLRFLAGIANDVTAHTHAIGIEPVASFTARAVTEVGEKLIETAWRHADIGPSLGRRRKNEARFCDEGCF